MTTNKKFDWKWIIPILTLAGSVIFLFISLMASHSGSTVPNPNGGITESDTNVDFWQTGYCWFFLGLLVATIFIYFAMKSDK